MKKQELKIIIKDMRTLKKMSELTDMAMHIITKNAYSYIHEYAELPEKTSINDIEVAIFIGSDTKAIYLKNGLVSYRIAKKDNLI